MKMAIEQAKHELELQRHEHEKLVAGQTHQRELLAADPTGAAAAHHQVLQDHLTPMLAGLQQAIAQMAAAHSAPIQIHRDPQTGRAIGASRKFS
jgi:hypothetical protein